jgi:hypothetical protein
LIIFESKPITPSFNSIPLENISAFDKNSAYVKGAQRLYKNKIYEALTDIPQTVNHIWNDTDSSNKFGFDLYTNAKIPDPTNVYVVNGVTLVYVMSNKKYYRAKHTGFVNYTTENPVTPTYFDDLGISPVPLYRTELNYPEGKKNTLFWEYKSGTNQNTMFDEVINKRAVNNRSFTTTGTTTFSNTGVITLASALPSNIYVNDKIKISGTVSNNGYYKISSISVNRLTITLDRLTVSETITFPIGIFTQTYIKWVDYGIDKVAIFNSICDSAELKVTVSGTTTTTYNIDMVDTSFINTFEIFCFNEPIPKMKSIETIIKNFNQEFELTFFGDFQEIGEIVQGQSYYLGLAEDSVSIDGKNYNPLVEAPNGDVYLQDEDKSINILDEKSISIIYDSTLNSALNDKLKSFMGKRLVVSGDVGDKEDLPFLLSYCFIKDYNFNPLVNHELNKFTLNIREFL